MSEIAKNSNKIGMIAIGLIFLTWYGNSLFIRIATIASTLLIINLLEYFIWTDEEIEIARGDHDDDELD